MKTPLPAEPAAAAHKGTHKKRPCVYFGPGSKRLESRDTDILDDLMKKLEGTRRRLRISGHMDTASEAKDNIDLSKERAFAVKKYLVDHGVDAERIDVDFFGDKQPIGKNSTEAGRSVNRRVEFRILPE